MGSGSVLKCLLLLQYSRDSLMLPIKGIEQASAKKLQHVDAHIILHFLVHSKVISWIMKSFFFLETLLVVINDIISGMVASQRLKWDF